MTDTDNSPIGKHVWHVERADGAADFSIPADSSLTPANPEAVYSCAPAAKKWQASTSLPHGPFTLALAQTESSRAWPFANPLL
jgi:hypothetical protein